MYWACLFLSDDNLEWEQHCWWWAELGAGLDRVGAGVDRLQQERDRRTARGMDYAVRVAACAVNAAPVHAVVRAAVALLGFSLRDGFVFVCLHAGRSGETRGAMGRAELPSSRAGNGLHCPTVSP